MKIAPVKRTISYGYALQQRKLAGVDNNLRLFRTLSNF